MSVPLFSEKKKKIKRQKWREPRTEMLLLFQKNYNGSTMHSSCIVAFPKIPLERTVCNLRVLPPQYSTQSETQTVRDPPNTALPKAHRAATQPTACAFASCGHDPPQGASVLLFVCSQVVAYQMSKKGHFHLQPNDLIQYFSC